MEDGSNSRSAFIINNDTAVYLKYASKPTKTYGEYIFTFTESHLSELAQLPQLFAWTAFFTGILGAGQELTGSKSFVFGAEFLGLFAGSKKSRVVKTYSLVIGFELSTMAVCICDAAIG